MSEFIELIMLNCKLIMFLIELLTESLKLIVQSDDFIVKINVLIVQLSVNSFHLNWMSVSLLIDYSGNLKFCMMSLISNRSVSLLQN